MIQPDLAGIKDEENDIKEYLWPLKARKSREIDFSGRDGGNR